MSSRPPPAQTTTAGDLPAGAGDILRDSSNIQDRTVTSGGNQASLLKDARAIFFDRHQLHDPKQPASVSIDLSEAGFAEKAAYLSELKHETLSISLQGLAEDIHPNLAGKVAILFDGLKQNANIRHLNIRFDSAAFCPVSKICELIPAMTLQSLSLDNCLSRATDYQFRNLRFAILRSASIIKLDLSKALYPSDRSFERSTKILNKVLLDCLGPHASIREVRIPVNGKTKELLHQMTHLSMPSLEKLDWQGMYIDRHTANLLIKVLNKHPSLVQLGELQSGDANAIARVKDALSERGNRREKAAAALSLLHADQSRAPGAPGFDPALYGELAAAMPFDLLERLGEGMDAGFSSKTEGAEPSASGAPNIEN